MPFLYNVLEALALCCALSTDAFISSFAYGANKIKIPFKSVTVINLTCTFFLSVSLLSGSFFSSVINVTAAKYVCFSILLIIGLLKIFDGTLKSLIRKHNDLNKKLSFSFFGLKFILNIYANPEQADIDSSHDLSAGEAFALAVALSLDGLAVGFSAGLIASQIWIIVISSLLTGAAAITLGCFLGKAASKKSNLNLGWIGGIILIGLAVMKIL